MPKFQRLTKVELIRNTLGTVVICEQCGATRALGQARRSLAHGNVRCHETAKKVVFWRNGGGLCYAISDKHWANPSEKEKPQATETGKSKTI